MILRNQLLKALQTEKAGNWNEAHQIVQSLEHPCAYWVHAYLHRKEPDIMNAGYWYSRAKKPVPDYSFEDEWIEIFETIQKS